MFTASTYIFVSICLAALLYFGAKEHHQVREGVEVFRYQSVFVWVAFLGIPEMVVIGIVIYMVSTPKPEGTGLFTLIAVLSLLALLFGIAFLYFKKFYVEVSDKVLRVGGFMRERVIQFADVRKIFLVEGGKGGMEISLFNAHDQRILKASSTLQDFSDLVDLIMERTRGYGVLIRSRDKWGKWTEQRL